MLPQVGEPARMFAIRRGSGYRGNNGMECVCCYSRLYLPPPRNRLSAPEQAFADCLGRNISNLVVHEYL
ncbi:hypothetical protein ACOSP7_024542 [Xanthoceras sorbifolium]